MFSPEGVIVPQGCLGRSEFANRIGGANSVPYNHASTLLGFWDMTTDGRTTNGPTLAINAYLALTLYGHIKTAQQRTIL